MMPGIKGVDSTISTANKKRLMDIFLIALENYSIFDHPDYAFILSFMNKGRNDSSCTFPSGRGKIVKKPL